MKELNDIYICIHQGIGDLFTSIGLINYYSKIFENENNKNIKIFASNEANCNILNAIYKNKSNVYAFVPDFKTINDVKYSETCFLCMMKASLTTCNRNINIPCKLVDYRDYTNNKTNNIIKIGSFDNILEWEIYKSKEFSFAHAFYTYNKLNSNIRHEYFDLFNDKVIENNIYANFIGEHGKDYILIHENTYEHRKKRMHIDKKKIINKNYKIINLQHISNIFVDYLLVIKNAKEIHLIDSSWSVLIYLLSHKHITVPVFFNETIAKSKGRDTNIYKKPIFDNWIFY